MVRQLDRQSTPFSPVLRKFGSALGDDIGPTFVSKLQGFVTARLIRVPQESEAGKFAAHSAVRDSHSPPRRKMLGIPGGPHAAQTFSGDCFSRSRLCPA